MITASHLLLQSSYTQCNKHGKSYKKINQLSRHQESGHVALTDKTSTSTHV